MSMNALVFCYGFKFFTISVGKIYLKDLYIFHLTGGNMGFYYPLVAKNGYCFRLKIHSAPSPSFKCLSFSLSLSRSLSLSLSFSLALSPSL